MVLDRNSNGSHCIPLLAMIEVGPKHLKTLQKESPAYRSLMRWQHQINLDCYTSDILQTLNYFMDRNAAVKTHHSALLSGPEFLWDVGQLVGQLVDHVKPVGNPGWIRSNLNWGVIIKYIISRDNNVGLYFPNKNRPW